MNCVRGNKERKVEDIISTSKNFENLNSMTETPSPIFDRYLGFNLNSIMAMNNQLAPYLPVLATTNWTKLKQKKNDTHIGVFLLKTINATTMIQNKEKKVVNSGLDEKYCSVLEKPIINAKNCSIPPNKLVPLPSA